MRIPAAIAATLAPLAARAHPGHENDVTAESWLHLLTEHALPR